MNSVIAEKISGFSLADYQPIFHRELDLGDPLEPRAGNLVTVVTGMRRSGKSYRLFQEIERLIESGTDSARILYFNFEDERLDPITPATGDEALEAFFTLHPEAFDLGAYFFFDEVQEMHLRFEVKRSYTFLFVFSLAAVVVWLGYNVADLAMKAVRSKRITK